MSIPENGKKEKGVIECRGMEKGPRAGTWETMVSERAFAAACDVLRKEMGKPEIDRIDELFRLHRQRPITFEQDISHWVDAMVREGKVSAKERGDFVELGDRLIWELRHQRS